MKISTAFFRALFVLSAMLSLPHAAFGDDEDAPKPKTVAPANGTDKPKVAKVPAAKVQGPAPKPQPKAPAPKAAPKAVKSAKAAAAQKSAWHAKQNAYPANKHATKPVKKATAAKPHKAAKPPKSLPPKIGKKEEKKDALKKDLVKTPVKSTTGSGPAEGSGSGSGSGSQAAATKPTPGKMAAKTPGTGSEEMDDQFGEEEDGGSAGVWVAMLALVGGVSAGAFFWYKKKHQNNGTPPAGELNFESTHEGAFEDTLSSLNLDEKKKSKVSQISKVG